jgi:hypothetical protein
MRAKLLNQIRCLPTDEFMKDMWYIYTMKYYSAIKNEITLFLRETDRTGAHLVNLSKPVTERYVCMFLCFHSFVESKWRKI